MMWLTCRVSLLICFGVGAAGRLPGLEPPLHTGVERAIGKSTRVRTADPLARSALRLLPSGRVAFRLQGGRLLIAEEPRAREEAHTLRRLDAETASAPRHHIDRELRVLPVLELLAPDVERHIGNGAEIHVALPNPKLASRKAHWRAPVAASARLMKHEGPMEQRELVQHRLCPRRNGDARNARRRLLRCVLLSHG